MLLADPVSAGRMGRVARRRVEREFTWEQVAQRTAALYESLLAARQRSHAGILSPQSTDIPDCIALFDSALAHS